MYQYDLADEPERRGDPADLPVVLVPLDRGVVTMEAGPDTRVVMTWPLLSPIGSLPHTLGRDIQLPGFQEVLPCSLEGRGAAETLEIEMGRRSVSDSIRPLRSGPPGLSTPDGPRITKKMVAEACLTLVQSRHPSSPPSWPEGTVPPVHRHKPNP